MKSTNRDPIIQQKLIAAPRQSVFDAWSQAESMSVWMCPSSTMSSASVEIDFRKGGEFRIVMHGEEGDYEQRGEYLEIDPPHRLVFSWISHFMPEGLQKTRVTLTLEEADAEKTMLTLIHDELPAGDHYDGHVEGWAEILQRLSATFS
jgi:uncharacterized protein YndB with AHSA1/START domain